MLKKGIRSLCCSPKSCTSSSSFDCSPSNFIESAIDRAVDAAEPIIVKWNTASTTFGRLTSLFYQNRREAREFIKVVNNLQKAMHFILGESSSVRLGRAQNLMRIAMYRLQKEFYQILSMNRSHLDPESVSTRSSGMSAGSSTAEYEEEEDDGRAEISEVEDASTLAMADLRLIAECMVSSGYTKECFKIYRTIRKSIVDESIYRLGVERFSSSQIRRMDWNVLDLRIYTWINALRTAVKTLFNGERILCDHVFACSDSIRESCFAEITEEGAMILFRFPENVAKNSQNSPEKVYRVLDMYAGISDHSSEIESIFSFQSTLAIKTHVQSSLSSLGEVVRCALDVFETVILKESSRSPIAGAGIHPLTIDTMNKLSKLADHSSILSDILSAAPPPTVHPLPKSFFDPTHSSVFPAPEVVHKIAWLILALLCRLDSKSKLYKDVALAYLFLANNLQYVVVRVRNSNLKHLLGDQWLTDHESKVKQFASSYERLGWGHVINAIPSDPTAVDSPEKLNEALVKFNTSISQAYRKQSACVIPDRNLRDHIKLSIARNIVPLYREFWNAHRQTIGRRRNFVPMVRYTPADVDRMLADLFFDSGTVSFRIP